MAEVRESGFATGPDDSTAWFANLPNDNGSRVEVWKPVFIGLRRVKKWEGRSEELRRGCGVLPSRMSRNGLDAW